MDNLFVFSIIIKMKKVYSISRMPRTMSNERVGFQTTLGSLSDLE